MRKVRALPFLVATAIGMLAIGLAAGAPYFIP
jgi:hypothetical protein